MSKKNKQTILDNLKASGEACDWMSEEGYKTMAAGYLLPDETPVGAYRRLAKAAGSYYGENSSYWEGRFFDVLMKGWLCPASPVLSNLGSDRALPISCYAVDVDDNINDIFMKNHELACLTQSGGGVGISLSRIRERGTPIRGNGVSNGVIPWARCYDTTTSSTSQGSVRRGASSIYLSIRSSEILDFINIRRQTGDVNMRCMNINHGVTIDRQWMKDLSWDKEKQYIWRELLRARVETGEPYIIFIDNVNDANPECYKGNNLKVTTSNICCLSGDTSVLTDNGYFRIDSLIGKTVNIWDGNNWVENDSFQHRGNDALMRITIKDGSFVDCNSKHRWFVAEDYTDIRNNKYKLKLANELKVGDFIQYHEVESHGDVEEKGAYLKGFILGDGTHVNDRPMLNLHSTKYSCQESLIKSANELSVENVNTNAISKVSFSEEVNNTGKHQNVFGQQIFKRMMGLSVRKNALLPWATSAKKNLPAVVFNWNKSSKLKFLAGLFDSDGTISKKSCFIQIASKYESFLKDLQKLLRSLSIASSIDSMERESGNTIYRLSLSSFDTWNLLNDLPTQRLKYSGKKPNRKTTGWRRIESIKDLPGIHPVYCPILPSTGKFALANGLMTGNTEIFLHTSPDLSFVCCLSSLNLMRWDEWKNTDLPNVAARFLDAVLSEFIVKAKGKPGMEHARQSAIKGRAIGVGVLGFHSLLQEKNIALESFDAMQLNAEIFRTIREKAEEETAKMAVELGEPEWCVGYGRRNSHVCAVAPTVSNSIISGGTVGAASGYVGASAGIEPIAANVFVSKTAKGTFVKKNYTLEKLLQSKGKNTSEIWADINKNEGSVQHFDFLSDHEKDVFKTAREVNQMALIRLAAQRQKWIDQGQSLNLFFASNADPMEIHRCHMEGHNLGLKSFYYFRSSGVLKADHVGRAEDEGCKSCEG